MPDDSFRELQLLAFIDYLFCAKFRMHKHEGDKTCPQEDDRDLPGSSAHEIPQARILE